MRASGEFLFTSESVSEGHPDKVCDQSAGAVLESFLENDNKRGISDDSKGNTRLGCEPLTTTNKIGSAGEGRGQAPLFRKHGDKAVVDRELITEIARGVVKDIGYDQDGFSWKHAKVECHLHAQSSDIAVGVDRMQQALDIEVRRVEHAWAGLRTFTPDGSLAFGWDPRAAGFFWCVGQGGYGIQTAPAAGRELADELLRDAVGEQR